MLALVKLKAQGDELRYRRKVVPNREAVKHSEQELDQQSHRKERVLEHDAL